MLNILKTIIVFALVLLLADTASASDAKFATISASTLSLNGAALNGGARSTAIDVGPNTWGSSEVSYQATITAGTTTAVTVSCEESADNKKWVWLPFCTNAASSACTKQTLVYTLASTPNFAVVVRPRARYLRCTFEDAAAGTGTISATATRVSL